MSGNSLEIKPFEEITLSCGHKLDSFLFARKLQVACPQCGTVNGFDKDGNFDLISSKKVKSNTSTFVLALGVMGELRGKKYRVVGMAEKKEDKAPYSWREYTLFNPVHGCVWLSEFNGHWTLVKAMDVIPVMNHSVINDFLFEDQLFKLYNSYKYVTMEAKGEFVEDIVSDVEKKCREFICPPEMLICEIDTRSVCWLKAEHIDQSEVKNAFMTTVDFPSKIGVGACEPFVTTVPAITVKAFTILAIAVLVLLQIILLVSSKNESVFNQTFSVREKVLATDSFGFTPAVLESATADTQTYITEAFELKGGIQSIEYTLEAPVSNNWMAADVELLNDETGEQYSFTQDVEYYFGHEGGEAWTEGDIKSEQFISSVPEGRYRMAITGYFNPNNRIKDFVLRIYADVPNWSNFFLSILVIIIYPIILFIRKNSFEKERWMNSDYSPYEYEE